MNNEKQSAVLIVDDNIRNLQVLGNILRDESYKIAMAKDGNKGLNFAERMSPDLILLDIMMPEMDGFETCRELKNNDATKEIPVIFISALHDTASKVKGFEAGGVDYITKPFQKDEVLARVKTHVTLKQSQEELKIAYEKLQKAYEELDLAARTDSLTKISNRRDMIERIKHEIIRCERNNIPFSLILCDIDDFKAFNDKYGHDCGDFVLVSVAKLMVFNVRKQDSVGRWGGEEFLLLLPETDLKGAENVAKKIKHALDSEYYEYNYQKLQISMTFGVSSSFHCNGIEQCIKMADDALYQGKKSGKNCIILSESNS